MLVVAFGPDGGRWSAALRTIRLWTGEGLDALGIPLTGHAGGVRAVRFDHTATRP